MPARVIAIGDIHGCARAFETLLEVIKPTGEDLVVPLGDYVDRGPDSRGVIDRLLELERQTSVRPLLGNHEEMMLDVLEGREAADFWLRYGGVQTLDSYGFAGDYSAIPNSHIDFLHRCLDYYETDEHFFVHANYHHQVPLAETDSELLRWRSLADSMPGEHHNGKVAVVGHTPDQFGEIMDVGFLKCIDTFCYGGMWLTAMDVLTGEFWQANENGIVRD